MGPIRRRYGALGAHGQEVITELRDAARRILWHWKLLIISAGLGVMLPVLMLSGNQPTYVASTRFLVEATTEASASIADTISAIATSPSQLESALTRINVDVDPRTLIDDVSVDTIGESGVVQLSVRNDDPELAAELANALRVHISALVHNPANPIYTTPRLLEPAESSTARQVPPLRSQDIVLGAALGLILGVVIASVMEALNPTLVGKEAIAVQLGAPVLGAISSRPRGGSRDVQWIRWRLGAQASQAGVANVELAAVDPKIDLYPISAALVTNGSSSQPEATANGSSNGHQFKLRVGILDASSVFPGGSAGLVIVTPATVKRATFESTQELLRITGWPAMGAIVYPGSRNPRVLIEGLRRAMSSAARKVSATQTALAESVSRTASGSKRPEPTGVPDPSPAEVSEGSSSDEQPAELSEGPPADDGRKPAELWARSS